ncbi:myc box-dependent-interacting protein 1b isoform X4 [Oncorhynchus tshawytscha]|uniref:Myc box-dependent-interacting protein 1 n=1 Tax=Oncorhynchus tshawytscha TaxID=74940 RepID=A0AAZ3RH09_ONCTS|nr:myc box-dependent-interacting protein 1b isoform X4 [Oncorhynchus tshawytscha]
MAEEQGKTGKGINTGKLATSMQKRLSRAQEKVLQKLGKADETRDTAFEEGVANFNKQMAEGTKLQKDLRAYLAAVKTMHDASKRLQDCLADMYEPEWFGKEEVDTIAEEMIEKEMDYCMEETDILWSDYHDKLVDNSMIAMDTYLAQFPDIKARIAKRDRKMTDYDSARHHFGSLQKGKKQDQAKIAKPMSLVEKAAPGWAQGILSAHQIAQTNLTRNQAEEELGRAQKVFEEINVDLQDELPQLWNSRVGFYVNTFQSMAGYQQRFHKDMGKLNQDLNDVMTKLDEQRLANEAAAANHSVTPDAAPKTRPAPPGPAPVRPPPSPRPSLTPAPDTQQQDIISFDGEALVPDANTTTPSQATAPSQATTPSQPQAASWDSWEPEPEQPPAVEEPQQNDDKESQETKAGWEEDEPAANQGGWGSDETGAAPSWDTEGTQASQACWDQDVTQTGHSQGGWGDNGAQVGEEAADAASDGQAGWGDAGAQAGWAEEPAADGQVGWAESGQTGWADSEQSTDTAMAAAAGAATTAVTNGSSEVLPAGVIYKVKAMHDYAATDGDELEMKAGDVVLVLAWENPDEQDDGWLMGVKESHWLENKDLLAKGVFPENFTQKL